MTIRKNHALRMKAFDELFQLKKSGDSRKNAITSIHNKYRIPKPALYQWYSGIYKPFGRRGSVSIDSDLFYVIGALLGDGCIYNWKITRYYVILVGDNGFCSKYARSLSKCTGKEVKQYISRYHNIWFVRTNNFALYYLFQKIRSDLSILQEMLKKSNQKSKLMLIEGFFDAEGCIKIIREKVRKVPKICPDITNTNRDYILLFQKLIKESMHIEAGISAQKGYVGKDGSPRKTAYHLRIYKKSSVKKFLNNIKTTKLKKEKVNLVNNWFNHVRKY